MKSNVITGDNRSRASLQAKPHEGEKPSSDKSLTKDVLEEALEITSDDRRNAYGPVDQDFIRIAAMWSAVMGIPVTAKQVALCMICLKISRATWSDKRDNWVDIAGYARCGSLLP